MINTCKFTENSTNQQIAGLILGDYNIEFVGVKDTKEVLFIQNGHTLPFKFLPKAVLKECKEQFLKDTVAVADLSKETTSLNRQIELYIYYLYGDVDTTPDVIDGKLTPSENFRENATCRSLTWNTKWITIDGIALSERDLKIIDSIKNDVPDKAIAYELNIAHSTFDFHKRNLYKKLNVASKTELLIKALTQNV